MTSENEKSFKLNWDELLALKPIELSSLQATIVIIGLNFLRDHLEKNVKEVPDSISAAMLGTAIKCEAIELKGFRDILLSLANKRREEDKQGG